MAKFVNWIGRTYLDVLVSNCCCCWLTIMQSQNKLEEKGLERIHVCWAGSVKKK